jgi:hypothetical protein
VNAPPGQVPGRGRRFLCRLGLHRNTEVADPAGPCQVEWRCSACDRLHQTRPNHDYASPVDRYEPCRTVWTCKRCGYNDERLGCRTHNVFLVDLPADQHPSYLQGNYGPCDFVTVCQDCGNVSTAMADHKWGPSASAAAS